MRSDVTRRLELACTQIGEALAEPTGFVPIRTLLEKFRAEIEIRPLLVEGMLASLPVPESPIAQPDANRWRVLVDSERTGISLADVADETQSRPLPVRCRNTIVHELVHALAFSEKEGAPEIRAEFGSEGPGGDWVHAVEQATERATPLLLVPSKALSALLRTRTTPLAVTDVADLARRFAVSRDVLIQRLNLLRTDDPDCLLERPALHDLAIGTAIRCRELDAQFEPWPFFSNFERNLEPELILRLRLKEKVSAREYFGSPDALRALADGYECRSTGNAGLLSQRNVQSMETALALEPTTPGSRRPRAFFVLRAT